jgi:hypothetical protein
MADHASEPWATVWLEARRRRADPVAALVAAGLADPDALEPLAEGPRPRADPPRPRLRPHLPRPAPPEILAELAARRAGPDPAGDDQAVELEHDFGKV